MVQNKNNIPYNRLIFYIFYILLFSAFFNLLILSSPLFMIQVYDRVLGSGSLSTLLSLFLIVIFLLIISAIIDFIRSRILAGIGVSFQKNFDARVSKIKVNTRTYNEFGNLAELSSNIRTISNLLASPGVGTIFDLPWTPIFILVMFVFHPWLGWFGIISLMFVVVLTLINKRLVRTQQSKLPSLTLESNAHENSISIGMETVIGLGMRNAVMERWRLNRQKEVDVGWNSSNLQAGFSAALKSISLILQSAVLGLGALLVIRGDLTGGMMIAGSILLVKTLTPVQQTLGLLPQIQASWTAWTKLSKLLRIPDENKLDSMCDHLLGVQAKNVLLIPGGLQRYAVRGINFTANPGDVIGIIGPTASGKSTLARALCGVLRPTQGTFYIGGLAVNQNNTDEVGKFIGYLPQEVKFLWGTIGENIARFSSDMTSEQLTKAALQADADKFIVELPEGYETNLSRSQLLLSGGQKQKIALARACFQNPSILVFDEPDANLDDAGLRCLNSIIASARDEKKIVFLVSHRQETIDQCNLLIFLNQGVMRGFGPKDEILKRLDDTNLST